MSLSPNEVAAITLTASSIDGFLEDQYGTFYSYDAVSQTFVSDAGDVFTYDQNGVFVLVVDSVQKTTPPLYSDTSNATMQKWADKNLPGASVIVQQQAKPGESFMDTLIRCLPNMALGAQQLALANINYQRAKAGQPPLDMSQYSGVSASVGLSPDTQKLLMYGVGAIVVAMLLKGNNGGRK